MAKTTIYNIQSGQPKTLDPVDAREHLETGRWTTSVPEKNFDETYIDHAHTGATELVDEDPASQEAYEARQREFEEAERLKAAETAAVEEDIKKSKSKK